MNIQTIIVDSKLVKSVFGIVVTETKATVVAAGNIAKESSLVGGLMLADKTVEGAVAATIAMNTATSKLMGYTQKLAQRIVDRQIKQLC